MRILLSGILRLRPPGWGYALHAWRSWCSALGMGPEDHGEQPWGQPPASEPRYEPLGRALDEMADEQAIEHGGFYETRQGVFIPLGPWKHASILETLAYIDDLPEVTNVRAQAG